LIVFFAIKYIVNRSQKVIIGTTWDCGTDMTPRMEITSTGFSRSIVLIFRGILRTSIQHEIEYHDDETRYLPKSRSVKLGVGDIYHSYFYQPLHKIVHELSLSAKKIQSGNVNAYISYIFIALVIALLFVL